MCEVFLNDFNWENVGVASSNKEVWWELYIEGTPYPQWFKRDDVLNSLNLPNDFLRFDPVM